MRMRPCLPAANPRAHYISRRPTDTPAPASILSPFVTGVCRSESSLPGCTRRTPTWQPPSPHSWATCAAYWREATAQTSHSWWGTGWRGRLCWRAGAGGGRGVWGRVALALSRPKADSHKSCGRRLAAAAAVAAAAACITRPTPSLVPSALPTLLPACSLFLATPPTRRCRARKCAHTAGCWRPGASASAACWPATTWRGAQRWWRCATAAPQRSGSSSGGRVLGWRGLVWWRLCAPRLLRSV